MQRIEKIILKNFKRFRSITLNCNNNLNVYIGDNEAGKSTILEAISIVLMARRR
ncbi:MAG: AAA family ATPase, partial [Ignavibacteria bacterium]|nr:AAA family ATPase [Ignavibacteria bacterium]